VGSIRNITTLNTNTPPFAIRTTNPPAATAYADVDTPMMMMPKPKAQVNFACFVCFLFICQVKKPFS
jgi:hypothetical protein